MYVWRAFDAPTAAPPSCSGAAGGSAAIAAIFGSISSLQPSEKAKLAQACAPSVRITVTVTATSQEEEAPFSPAWHRAGGSESILLLPRCAGGHGPSVGSGTE